MDSHSTCFHMTTSEAQKLTKSELVFPKLVQLILSQTGGFATHDHINTVAIHYYRTISLFVRTKLRKPSLAFWS